MVPMINKKNSKAISYCKYKNTVCLEPYLFQSFNQKHRIAITRTRNKKTFAVNCTKKKGENFIKI